MTVTEPNLRRGAWTDGSRSSGHNKTMGAALARDAPPALQTLVSALLRTKLELALAGLDGSGKTTIANALRAPSEHPDLTTPTIGLVVQRARYRGVDLMLWDLGGHHRFRDDWSRHVRGCGALIFVVDVADSSRYGEARQALQRLIEDPVIGEMPLLVLANKVDLLPPAERASEELRGWPNLMEELLLDQLLDGSNMESKWSILGVSATRRSNLDKVLRWLVLQAHGAGRERGETDDAEARSEGGSRLWRLWEDLGAWRRRKWKGWGRGAGFSVLATSLIGAEA